MCRIIKSLILCLILIFLLAGCQQGEQSKEIVIGVAWPFASYNNLFNEGIDLAVKEINESGGINGKELRLLKKDDGSELEKGLLVARSFIDNEEVVAVIGHEKSFVSIPASALYEEAGLVMLSPASTASELTQNGYDHVFRCLPSDDAIARQMAVYAAQQGHQRMVIYYSDDAYGNGLANAFEDQARSQGITIVDRISSYTSLEDLRHISARWNAYGVEGIFLARSMPGGEQIIFDAAQAGIKNPFYGGDALEAALLDRKDNKAAEGIVIGSVFNPYEDRLEVKKFIESFQKQYNVMPSADAALGYDAIKVLAEAMKRADLQERSAIAAQLRDLGKYPGVCGVHEISKTGDDEGDLVVMKKMQNGKFVYLPK